MTRRPVIDLVIAASLIAASVASIDAAVHGLAPILMYALAVVLWTISIVLLVR